ncbi:hypothetical protein CC85DRAFT_299937 [Cutaneotrichosporon oleaginosum]|uniref:Zn(2)-C6 fungal-type domain-containing protein n=1 Tax=Cutaneotrichosporon oleaginosum TaxID=879819 RepID=A0A0J0XVH3_9TREE|nr:uncharacterized protein CC85DRAFT_299937 [Cutaneotrichosporon oleaginosum]KLT45067.1 hypothetical protein CC85DRAFT_299937 [Cutaneotrichosporon oleaginosum]TXT09751.1 hypothetical protein COLE_03685 [Cutaneotrichosporon oleaginosum]
MKVPTARRSSSDASGHYSPYPPTSSLPNFSQPAPPARTNSTPTIPESPLPGPEQPTYKVARAISSCTRCRSRKQKCDGKLPACSACERAKVECIGFDAISKTNVSRNYLHQLEQEVASLRAQVASLQSGGGADPIGRTKRDIAAHASHAVNSFGGSSGLAIDPTLQGPEGEPPMRSPWDSPSGMPGRRSEYPLPPTPLGTTDSPRSPVVGSSSSRRSVSRERNQNPITSGAAAATSLTRMVQDAALRTGHAVSSSGGATLFNSSNGRAGESPSDGKDSPVTHMDQDRDGDYHTSPEHVLTPRSGALPMSSGRAPSVSSSSGKRMRRAFVVPPLPPQPAVERLVAAYVDFVGVTAPIIHIPTLGKQLQRMREGVDVDESDVFVVMMVLALSTMASSRFVDPPDELRTCSEAFHNEALKHLDSVFESQNYISLQAILLLVWYSLLNPDKGSIWFLVGLATRTCVDLGFHNENNSQTEKIDNLELDMRRRLFWITYKMDRLLSQSLGRPPSIPDGFICVPMPAVQHDVDIKPGQYGPYTGEPCAYKAVFVHTVKLRQLQSEILNNTYGVNNQPPPKEEWFDDMFERLKSWLSGAPEPRGTVSTEGYAISFHNSCLLLFRPSRGNPKPSRNSLGTVLASSSYIIRIYRRMQINNRISWLWMTSHFSFMAGLSYLYAFYNLYSLGDGRVPTLDEAMVDIDSCLAVLEYLAPRVPSAQACHDTMKSVSQAITEQLSKMSPPRKDGLPQARSPGGRFRAAALSSARDDPLPNDATFPAPLPPTTLPYELTLLEHLFLNPLTSHHKASGYTNGAKAAAAAAQVRKNCTKPNAAPAAPAKAEGNIPSSLPPSAFHSFGPYGMAAQVSGGNQNTPSLASVAGAWLGTNAGQAATSTVVPGAPSGVPNAINAELALSGMGGETNGTPAADASGGGVDPSASFDIFSFLMDEEGGLNSINTGSWNALDVPADFPLWS